MTDGNGKATVVSFVLDESGSMHRNRWDTIAGFNDYIGELKEDPSQTLIRLQTFNSTGFKVPFQFEDVHKLGELSLRNFVPAAMTPLLDAVGLAISDTEEFITGLPEQPQVIVTIMTDGLENASSVYTSKQIQKMIEKKKGQGWIFTYLGANHDAWYAGRDLGIDRMHVSRFSANNPKAAFRRSARSTLNFKQISSLLHESLTREFECPHCDPGTVQMMKNGLYGCSNFVTCGWSTRHTPISRPVCPQCSGLLLQVRNSKVICFDENCGYAGDLMENWRY